MRREVTVNYLSTTGIPYFLQEIQLAQGGQRGIDRVSEGWKSLVNTSRMAGINESDLAEMISKKQVALEINLLEPWQDTVRICVLTARDSN